MPAIPDPLKPEHCALLQRFSGRLTSALDEFNKAIEIARKLATVQPQALVQQDIQDTLTRLAEVRASLTTPRFKVGFLGPFQCGKSTILNNLLGQNISAVGVGRACTSVITRLVVDRGRAAPELSLQYFTEDAYRARRNTLCEWARVSNPAGRSEAQLLELLRNHNPNAGGASARRPIRQKDIPYLRAFLQSYDDAKSRRLVRPDVAYSEIVSYADRERLLMHDPNVPDDQVSPSQYLLVAESIVSFPTDQIDPELELVDCPGLGSGRSVDDLLTKEYIQQLDGAIVFLRAGAMDSAEVSEILSELRGRFRENLLSRVWVVVNQMDVPERHAKIGGPKKQTTFDVIIDLMQKNTIPLSQVCLGCNGIFELANASGGKAERASALATIKLTYPGDDATIKARLAATPELAEGYEELLKDGSVGLLRRLIKERVGPSVAQQILAQASIDSRKAVADLEYALKQAEKPASEQEQKDALSWENTLYLLLSELSGGRPSGRGSLFIKLEELGRSARTQLEKEFLAHVQDDVIAGMSTQALLGRFGIDANRMQRELEKEFDRVVVSMYTEVTNLLQARNLPAVPLPGGQDPMAVWLDSRQQDRAGGAWRDRLRPQLYDQDFLNRLSEEALEQTFTGPKYKQLLMAKLRTAAHQITLAVRGQLRHRIDAVRRQVSRKLGPSAAPPAPVRPE